MKYPVSATRITDCLHEYNMSAQDLANKTGLNKASISQYVNGKNVPNNVNAGKIAEVFNVKPAWIMGFDVDKTSTEDLKQQFINHLVKGQLLKEISENEDAVQLAANFLHLTPTQQTLVMNLVAEMAYKNLPTLQH